MAMDFVTHLPRSVKRYDSIWVIVDRLKKCVYFLAINQKWSLDKRPSCMFEKWLGCMLCQLA